MLWVEYLTVLGDKRRRHPVKFSFLIYCNSVENMSDLHNTSHMNKNYCDVFKLINFYLHLGEAVWA